MNESPEYLKKVYSTIKDTKEKYGVYYKTLFHLHTPASHDYKLKKEWEPEQYNKCAIEEIIALCKETATFPLEYNLDGVELPRDLVTIYTDLKDWLVYMLLAKSLINADIEIVLVTDHNCVSGIPKLKKAIELVNIYNKDRVYPEVISGVEISCADKLHIVGMFPDDKKTQVNKWLSDNLISSVEGTYKTSLDVLSFFKSIGGFAYIAHINSSELFDGKKYLSGAYKKKLIEEGCFNYVGVHSLNHVEGVKKSLKNYGVQNCMFFIDNDAHSIDNVAENTFWIKTGKRKYGAIVEAINDYEVSITFNLRPNAHISIDGIYIEPCDDGFLSGKNNQPFTIRLSNALNCFIGGRGTGKSTVLQIVDYVLSQRVDDERMLDFLCSHGNVWILCSKNDQKYLIKMNMPHKVLNTHILYYFGQNPTDRHGFRYQFDPEQVRDYALHHYVDVYEVTNNNDVLSIQPVSSKPKILESIYNTRYSVNKLVQTASSDEIHRFVYDLMFRDQDLSSAESLIRARSKSGLLKSVRELPQLLLKRKKEVEAILEPFNQEQKGLLLIKYEQTSEFVEPDVSKWLLGYSYARKRDFNGLCISEENTVEYLLYVCRIVGVYQFIALAIDKDQKQNRYQYNISDFLKDSSIKETEMDRIVDTIFDSLITEDNIDDIIRYIKATIKQQEKFYLLFNINSKTGNRSGCLYRDVRELSMGQKVVAMLDFVLGYSKYIHDERPLIIDQPEDNLDNQYIYNNLVRKLREEKDKRQVIIATHNATIVTNSMTDQVCVMQSNGKHGWIECTGYPSEDRIKKQIINYLEGGIDSFKHKQRIYSSVM